MRFVFYDQKFQSGISQITGKCVHGGFLQIQSDMNLMREMYILYVPNSMHRC